MHCKICGDIATSRNYGVISCMSCKVFFQRHGLKNMNTAEKLKCYSTNGPCRISPNTRKHCIYCRLSACLQAGMRRKIKILRKTNQNEEQLEEKHRWIIEQKYKRIQLVTLDLLHADRSSLSINQWNLISNITHIYDIFCDEHRQKILRLRIDSEQTPVKFRLKFANYQQLVSTYFTFLNSFIKHNPDYQSFKLSEQLSIVHYNMTMLISTYGHYIERLIGFISYLDKSFAPIIGIHYSREIIVQHEKIGRKIFDVFHPDLILIKLILTIFAFGNVTPCLIFTSESLFKSMNDEIIFSKKLLKVQNTYVDVLWRYMLFRFRHDDIVVHLYSNIIFNCLHGQKFMYGVSQENNLHKDMLDNLTEEIETKLHIED